MPARTIAFVNQSKGTGKTTMALNVAAAFAKNGATTMLVEGSIPPRFASEMGLSDSGVALDRDAREVLRSTKINGLSVLCGYGMSVAEGNAGTAAERLRKLEDQFDVIIFDTPPRDAAVTKEVLRLADHVIIPSRADANALEELPETLRLLLDARSVNPSLSVMGMALSMGDSNAADSQTRASLQQIFGVYRTLQFETEIRHDRQIAAAMESFSPVVGNLSSAAASSYTALAKEIDARLPAASSVSRRRVVVNLPEPIRPITDSAPLAKGTSGGINGLLNWVSGLFGRK